MTEAQFEALLRWIDLRIAFQIQLGHAQTETARAMILEEIGVHDAIAREALVEPPKTKRGA